MIEINHVSKTFGTKKAVDDITVTIPTGCITGFIGPNGAGKTTSIHMMTGVLQPDTGSIKLNGKDITKDPIEAKREFGLVPDSQIYFCVYPALNILTLWPIFTISIQQQEMLA